MDVTCLSLSDFRAEVPMQSVAVISIRDDGQSYVNLDGWGPALVCMFMDVEYDVDYLRVWGWRLARQTGLFMPSEARRIRAFVESADVREAAGLVVHCHAGESRSVAVGRFAAELLGWNLVLRHRARDNKTVAMLLRDPLALGDENAASVETPEGRGLPAAIAKGMSGLRGMLRKRRSEDQRERKVS